MKFKRGRSRRRVRCTLCTPYRWQGNGKERRPAREVALRAALDRERRVLP